MTFGEIDKLEAKLGHRPSQQEIRDEETLQLMQIKAYVNLNGYTDVKPYEVVKVISDITVEVRPMKTKQTRFPKDFHVGGFCGHYSDNRGGQEYEYLSDESLPVSRIRWSTANRQWQQGKYMRFAMADAPYKFHDYNF